MNEAEALSKMVAPRDPRRHIWKTGIIQVLITKACNLFCANCSQLSQIKMPYSRFLMTPDVAEVIFKSVARTPFVIGVFGGSPCASKHFAEICEVMQGIIPFERRGLWANALFGKGDICRRTFSPEVSNLNLHQDLDSFAEFKSTWPESVPYLKGVTGDSRHSPPLVSMKDLDVLPTHDHSGRCENTEENRYELISRCSINKNWSSLAMSIDGKPQGFFCEIAATQACHHVDEPEWQLGVPIKEGEEWWNNGMDFFAPQVRQYCHNCSIPVGAFGQLALGGDREQVSPTHAKNYNPKVPGRNVELITMLDQLGEQHLATPTNYIQNASLPIIQ